MKIISPFKDFYDFIVAKYGIDSKAIYNRVHEVKKYNGEWVKEGMYVPDFVKNKTTIQSFKLYFCGIMYHGYVIGEKIFYDNEIMSIESITAKVSKPGENPNSILRSWKYRREKKVEFLYNKKEDLNEKYNCPVVFTQETIAVKNIRLSDIDFARILDPEKTFSSICNWLLRESPVENKQTDKEKVLSHGFDPITSFRKM